jgi:arginyl-tRNA synthetase
MATDDPFRVKIAEAVSASSGVPFQQVLVTLTTPPDPALGDFAFPCFALAKHMGQSPQVSAQGLVAKIGPIESVAWVKPAAGYVNFGLEPLALVRTTLGAAVAAGEAYGGSDEGRGKTVCVDYSSPNIAKPFHVGHLRSTVLGAALIRIYRALGYTVVGINHLGDWGTQFGQILAAWRRWGEGAPEAATVAALNDLYVRWNRAEKEDPGLRDEARQWFKRLEEGDAEGRRLWAAFREVSLREFDRIYDLLGVTFDAVAGESFYNEKIDALVRALEAKGLAVASEGALVVPLDELNVPPFILRKADEATLYGTRDLAAALYRHETYAFERMLYVVGAPQALHFRQLFAVLERMGCAWAGRCVHVPFGQVLLRGKRLSSRAGGTVSLEELIERGLEMCREILAGRQMSADRKEQVARAVTVGAIAFNDLKTRRIKDVEFDWDQVLSFDPETRAFKGETGPYLQYTHTRLSSLLRRHGRAVDRDTDVGRLGAEQELGLVRLLYRYPALVRQAAEEYEPSAISRYLIDVASAVSRYWHDVRILTEDAPLTEARVLLCWCARNVLRSGLDLLGVPPLEEM